MGIEGFKIHSQNLVVFYCRYCYTKDGFYLTHHSWTHHAVTFQM